jgi:RNA polymerase sigma-70 factor, ECF subfamily
VLKPWKPETGARLAIDVEAAYVRYGPMVLRRCRRLLRDEEAAVDAMHDVFVALVKNGARLEDRGMSALLFRTATNVSLNALRSRRRRREDPSADDDVIDRIADTTDAHERTLSQMWFSRVLRRVPHATRELAIMHLVDGLTLEETATAAGMSVSGVRKRLAALKLAVRELESVGERR